MSAAPRPKAVEPLPRRRRGQGFLVALGVAVALALGAIAAGLVYFLDRSDPAPENGEPTEVSVAELRDFAAELGRPVYWAGERAGRRLELTMTEAGDVYVRYLSGDAQPGDGRALFTTVGTYPRDGAYDFVERSGGQEGFTSTPAPGGGIATWDVERPTSIYLAYPGSDYVIEVYDPDPRTARALVLGGEVGPVR